MLLELESTVLSHTKLTIALTSSNESNDDVNLVGMHLIIDVIIQDVVDEFVSGFACCDILAYCVFVLVWCVFQNPSVRFSCVSGKPLRIPSLVFEGRQILYSLGYLWRPAIWHNFPSPVAC